MYLTGFADEAASGLAGQIEATRTLGWKYIESRAIDGVNIHDLPEEAFDRACGQLEEAGIGVNCFGSTIANWGKDIRKPFDVDLEQAKRAARRMTRLGTRLIRVMSYAVIPDAEDQMKEERFRRLRELKKIFDDAGVTMVHENCMNYGGISYRHTLELVDNVPGLKLVFDTGNPVQTRDFFRPGQRQSAWEFYSKVKEHVAYVHIKDGVWENDRVRWTFPGEGQGDVKRILEDLLRSGYDGGISIEPHLDVVFHEQNKDVPESDIRFDNYVRYGRMTEDIIRSLKHLPQ
ncbi:MAG: sugar phosphate isomerase/epimerase [Abditibacteriota bacterium]|nr:sugar phosphate isomerase/epimerase [Abditibacteriota bacterium]